MSCHWFLQRRIFTPICFLLCLGLHRGHWNGLSVFVTAQHSKRGAIRVIDSEDEKASAWSAWPPSSFIQFHVLSSLSSDEAAGVLWLPFRMHNLSCSIIISCFCLSFPHHIYLWSFLWVCVMQSLWGRDFLRVPVYPASWPAAAESLCAAPTEILWKSEQHNGRCHKDHIESHASVSS